MTYIVMECHPAFAVLVDEEGRFVKAANRNYEVGQRVSDPILMEPIREKQTISIRTVRRMVLAVAACLLVVLGVARFAATPSPYMSVTMTINPTVRIDADENGNVVRAAALNDDGEALLKDVMIEQKTLVAVTDELLDRAVAMGFLKENGTVTFDVDCENESQKSAYERLLVSHSETHLEGHHVTVEAVDASADPTEPTSVITDPTTKPTASSTKPTDEPTTYISRDEALQIVLDDIGVTLADVSEWDAELDEEQVAAMYGVTVYEVEVTVNDTEYDYTVEAVSGAIIDFEIDQETED